MSAAMIARAAMLGALRGDAALGALVNQIADGEPVKASAPWLMLGPGQASGWGARGVDGVTLRQTVELAVRGDQAAVVETILARVGVALGAMDGALGDWRVTSLRLERSRIRRTQAEWRAVADFAVRLVRLV